MKPLSENTMLCALYHMGYHSRATVHGFRVVFSTMANEKGFDGDVIEKAHEQRRELMQWWGNLLQEMEYAKFQTDQSDNFKEQSIGKSQ